MQDREEQTISRLWSRGVLSFRRWKRRGGEEGLPLKGRDMEELGVVKGTKLLLAKQKTRNKKQNFFCSSPSLKESSGEKCLQ